mmetsp:Transcript_1224/g.5188  ORF Transcript_1224/g.5188 Transcript_1224/m.5188 type:complete len:203 (-) Transcript_1224:3795-4403(-)
MGEAGASARTVGSPPSAIAGRWKRKRSETTRARPTTPRSATSTLLSRMRKALPQRRGRRSSPHTSSVGTSAGRRIGTRSLKPPPMRKRTALSASRALTACRRPARKRRPPPAGASWSCTPKPSRSKTSNTSSALGILRRLLRLRRRACVGFSLSSTSTPGEGIPASLPRCRIFSTSSRSRRTSACGTRRLASKRISAPGSWW